MLKLPMYIRNLLKELNIFEYEYDINEKIIKPIYTSSVIIDQFIKLIEELEKRKLKFEIIEEYTIKVF